MMNNRRRCVNAVIRLRMARHAHLQIAQFDLDLGEIGVVKDTGEIADQLLVNTGLLYRHVGTFSCSTCQSRAASACNAKV